MRGCIRKETAVAWGIFKRSPPILDFWTFRVHPLKIFWPHFSSAVSLADPARDGAAGTGLLSHRGWDFCLSPSVSWSCPILPTRPPARTPPGFARQGGFLGRSTGTGAFVPPGHPRSRVDPLGPKSDLPWAWPIGRQCAQINLSELAELFPACLISLRLFQNALEKSTRQRWAASLYVSRVPSEGCEQP